VVFVWWNSAVACLNNTEHPSPKGWDGGAALVGVSMTWSEACLVGV
jgi:hypothetical protein